MNKVLLLGKNGQVGWELSRLVRSQYHLITTDRSDLDLAKPQGIQPKLEEYDPDVIINAAAYTDVDGAEANPDRAFKINAKAPAKLAAFAAKTGALLVHYSTDYIFDGTSDSLYREEDSPNPINIYGASKLAGEEAIQATDCNYLILRTSWVFSLRRECFVTNVLNWAKQNSTLRIVDDQIGSPTWCRDLAKYSTRIIQSYLTSLSKDLNGVYHLVNKGAVNRYNFARAILQSDSLKQNEMAKRIIPCSSAEFSNAAKRPGFSALSTDKVFRKFGISPRSWRDALESALEDHFQ